MARRGGVEVADWTVDWTVRVRFPVYHYRVWAIWLQGGKRRLRMSRCPFRGRFGKLKSPSCPWRWMPGSRSKIGKWTSVLSLHSRNIIKSDVNHNQTTHQISLFYRLLSFLQTRGDRRRGLVSIEFGTVFDHWMALSRRTASCFQKPRAVRGFS